MKNKKDCDMKKLHKIALTPPLAAISAVLFTAFAAVAATINVPGDYADIASALANASAEDTVEVDEGTYQVSAAISIPAGVTLVAPKGPEKTEIKSTGSQDDVVIVDGANLFGFAVSDAKGKYAVRILNDGVVSNCVIRNATFKPSDRRVAVMVTQGTLVRSVVTNIVISGNAFSYISGSAVRLESGLVDACVLAHNSAANSSSSNVKSYQHGAAIYLSGGTLRNSLIADNYSQFNAMGVDVQKAATIDGCTIAGNYNLTAQDADSVGLYMANGTVVNTIIWGNENKNGAANVKKAGGTMTYSCTTPAVAGTGNVSGDPNFNDPAAYDYRIGFGSAIDAATPRSWHEGALDLAGEGRVFGNGPDIGCYESHSTDLGCGFSLSASAGVAPLRVAVTGTCSAGIEGTTFKWYFTGGDEPDVTMVGEATAEWTYDDLGSHDIRLEVENGGKTGTKAVTGAVTVYPAVCYVDAANIGKSVSPYLTPATAATNIADAVAVGYDGTEVRVAAGTYLPKETVSVSRGVRIIGAGADQTVIRSVAKATSISLSSDGALLANLSVLNSQHVSVTGGTVSNCVIAGCTFTHRGGGVQIVKKGHVVGCIITNNIATSGNVWSAGGGIFVAGEEDGTVAKDAAVIENCVIAGNVADVGGGDPNGQYGGGGVKMNGGTIRNSLIAGNTAAYGPGGANFTGTSVENCTVVSNLTSANFVNFANVGGACARGSTEIVNTIVYGNSSKTLGAITNFVKNAGSTASVSHSLVGEPDDTEAYEGAGNIRYQDPLFKNPARWNYRLRGKSVCVGAGDMSVASATDLDGNPRVFGGKIDLGCYECQSGGMLLLVK